MRHTIHIDESDRSVIRRAWRFSLLPSCGPFWDNGEATSEPEGRVSRLCTVCSRNGLPWHALLFLALISVMQNTTYASHPPSFCLVLPCSLAGARGGHRVPSLVGSRIGVPLERLGLYQQQADPTRTHCTPMASAFGSIRVQAARYDDRPKLASVLFLDLQGPHVKVRLLQV